MQGNTSNIKIYGTGFGVNSTVYIGSTICSNTLSTDSEINCSPGKLNVKMLFENTILLIK